MTWLLYLIAVGCMAGAIHIVAAAQARIDGTARRYDLEDRP